MLISENLPCRAGFAPTPGRLAAKRFDWTPGGRQPGAGSREAREIRMFNHWAAGLWSGVAPQDCGATTPKKYPQNASKIWRFALWFWCVAPGNEFLNSFGRCSRVWRSFFVRGLPADCQVGGELLSIRQNLFQKSSKFGRAPNFTTCPKRHGEVPHAPQNIK